MHHHNPSDTHSHSTNNHLLLLVAGIGILGGIYLLSSQDLTVTALGGIVFILAHLAIAGGVLYLGRGFIRGVVQRLHGASPAHSHTHDNLETTGATISWAYLYDILVNLILFGQERKMREATITLARIQPGERVIDVGCGTGTLAITAKKRAAGAQIHGTDAAPEMIERAREKALKAGVEVDFRAGLVEAIDFPANTFDIVLSSLMVHHLPPDLKSKAFAEIFRVLKPGGRLLIVDFEPPQRGLTRTVLSLFLGQGMMQIDNSAIPPMLTAAGFAGVEKGETELQMATYIAGRKPADYTTA